MTSASRRVRRSATRTGCGPMTRPATSTTVTAAVPRPRRVPVWPSPRADASAGAGDDGAPPPAQPWGSGRMGGLTDPGPAGVSRVPLRQGDGPTPVPRVRVHRRNGEWTRWGGMKPSCADVPAVADPPHVAPTSTRRQNRITSIGTTCSTLDWLGNESEGATLGEIPSSSTFAYTSDLPVTPTVLAPVRPPGPRLWPRRHLGSGVRPGELAGLRRVPRSGGRPVPAGVEILTTNSFTDLTARRGVDYLYCVQSVDPTGLLSRPSIPVLHHY